MKGGEIGPIAQNDEHRGAEMASSSFTGLLNRAHRESSANASTYAEADRSSGARKKGDYATVALQHAHDDGLGDDFYDEQLRSDGWHLDETSDDEQLDFSLPKALPAKAQAAECGCAPGAATIRRISTRAMQQCAVM